MQVNKISNSTSFKGLYIGGTIDKKFAQKFSKEISDVVDIIKKNKFDKKRFVDVILNHDDIKGFFAVVSSKKQGVPMHPDYSHRISNDNKVISSFKQWLNDWNGAYSPKTIKQLEHAEKMFKN